MTNRLYLALKGMCMGFADAIPGVSGGTMALILGVYERFILALTAILHPRMIATVLKRRFWGQLKAELLADGADESDEGIAAAHVAFMANLAVGILGGLLVGVLILPVLLDRYPEIMRGFFFGLVLASIVVPWGMIKQRNATVIAAFVVACVATFMLMGIKKDVSGFATTTVTMTTAEGRPLTEARSFDAQALRFATDTGQAKLRREIGFQPTTTVELKAGESSWTIDVVAAQNGVGANLPAGSLVQVVDSHSKKHSKLDGFAVTQAAAATGGTDPALWYIFICGAIAICAMVLPGVSGAFLLLMFGLYGYILHTLRALLHLDMSALPVIAIFIAGILLGLTFFSRLLRWGLAHHHDLIMGVLAGLMLGSLRSLWPFRTGVGHVAENTLPQSIDSGVLMPIAALIVGVVIVTALTAMDRRGSKATQPSAS